MFAVNSSVPFYDFTINSTNNPSVQLITSNLTISHVLTLNGGVLDAATNSLTVIVTNNATGAIVRTSGFVSRNLQRAFFGGNLYNFPVGTGTNEYSPVSVNFTSGSFSNPTVTARAYNTKHPNYPVTSNHIKRYWNVTVNGISSATAGYHVTATYLPGDVVGNTGNITLGKYTGI